MAAQNKVLLFDYACALTTSLSKIRCECAKSSSIAGADKLDWDEILIYRTDKPLPTLKEYFKDTYEFLLHNNNEANLNEIDKTISVLNETQEIIIWKQGVNYLLQLIKGDSYKPFYHGEGDRPELFVLAS